MATGPKYLLVINGTMTVTSAAEESHAALNELAKKLGALEGKRNVDLRDDVCATWQRDESMPVKLVSVASDGTPTVGTFVDRRGMWRQAAWEVLQEAVGEFLDIYTSHPDMQSSRSADDELQAAIKDAVKYWEKEDNGDTD
jgi:hypothetical protein